MLLALGRSGHAAKPLTCGLWFPALGSTMNPSPCTALSPGHPHQHSRARHPEPCICVLEMGWTHLQGTGSYCFSPSLDDGAIRVWKNFADLEKNPEMVTAWQGLSDMLPTTRGGSARRHATGSIGWAFAPREKAIQNCGRHF